MAKPIRSVLNRILKLLKLIISFFLMLIIYLPFVIIQHILLAVERIIKDTLQAIDETFFSDVK